MSFTIKELEALSGIKAHTIRIWEQRYSFLKPSRTQTNIRSYSNEELKTILTVALLNKHGYKISKIDNMQQNQRQQEVLGLKDADARQEQIVNDLIAAMVDLEFLQFEKVLATYIGQHNIYTAISTVIFSFLERVGILWQTNSINPAHEHVATSIVRQKLIAAIDQLPDAAKTVHTFLLFLPEDEHHELGLLFVYYLLKKSGIPVLYLGANVPLKDVVYVVQTKNISHLYLHLTTFPQRQNFSKYLLSLSEKCPSATIILSGFFAESYKKPLPASIQTLKSLSEVNSYISSIHHQ